MGRCCLVTADGNEDMLVTTRGLGLIGQLWLERFGKTYQLTAIIQAKHLPSEYDSSVPQKSETLRRP